MLLGESEVIYGILCKNWNNSYIILRLGIISNLPPTESIAREKDFSFEMISLIMKSASRKNSKERNEKQKTTNDI